MNPSDPKDSLEEDHVEKVITSSQGGTLITPDGIELVIPPNALPSDGTVGVAQVVDALDSVPNPQLTIVGDPITIEFPTDSLSKPIQLSFPRPSSLVDPAKSLIVESRTNYNNEAIPKSWMSRKTNSST